MQTVNFFPPANMANFSANSAKATVSNALCAAALRKPIAWLSPVLLFTLAAMVVGSNSNF